MNDQTLLMFGVGISFIVLAGVYVFFRERYERDSQAAEVPADVESTEPRALRGATRET
jgi:hypothetical protein